MNQSARRVAAPRDIRFTKPIGTQLVSLSGETMGTTWSVRAIVPPDFNTTTARAALEAALDAIIQQMSTWRPDADISRFNDLPAGASITLNAQFRAVIECALAVAAETDGAFDPTIGALVDLWGFGPTPRTQAPSESEIRDALALAGWRKLSLTTTTLAQPGGLRLDLSGIAKGYAVDELARVLSAFGLNSYLVEIGGELRGAGVKPDAQPWWVDLEAPPASTDAPILLTLHDLAVATSGDYRRFREHDGQHIAHIIDPRTGRPLDNTVASVTVIHESCMLADAYATALSVMGAPAALAFADAHALPARIFTRGDASTREYLSAALADMLGA